MGDSQVIRRLAAVLASDVVGFSSMMSQDEVGTLAALKDHREKTFDPAVEQFRGRIIKLMGDGALVEFTSVVDALDCAIAVQSARADVGGDQITLRIGINLGDVIIDGDDIYGNGVNLAARLEPLAQPGGICISSVVKDSVGGRTEVVFSDGGSVSVKNIDQPVRVWHWNSEQSPPVKASVKPRETQSSPASTASVAVLPFDNMSGDPEQEYFSDGICEDIITDLSKVSGMMVIARNSSFAYKGKAQDLRQVGRELGVSHILEGSVRKAGNRVRINAQLIEAETGAHLWAERYDRDLTDIFEVQDELTLTIVDALKVTLQPGEKDRIKQQGTTNLQAYDCFVRARGLLAASDLGADGLNKAIQYGEQALALDADFGPALSILALAHLFNYQNDWIEVEGSSLDIARDYGARAVELSPDEAFVHQIQVFTAQMLGDPELTEKSVERALELEPNGAFSLMGRSTAAIYRGEPEMAFEDIEKALRLDPGFSHQYLHFAGIAHFFLGNYEAAEVTFRERLLISSETDSGRAMLASTLGHLGKAEEAREVWAELQKLFPGFSYHHRVSLLPYSDPTYPERIFEGLRKAGIEDEQAD